MALKFVGKSIPGSTGQIQYAAAEPHITRFRFWGLKGETEIAGESGGRSIVVPHILHGSYAKHSDLLDGVSNLDSLQHRNGKLEFTSGSGVTLQKFTFDDTTFEGYQMAALPGQDAPGPLKDVTGTLFNDAGAADGGWFLFLTLHFRQLAV